VVTGASSGIGRAIALAAGVEGADVVVNYARSRDRAQEVVEEIARGGGRAIAVGADVSRSSEVQRLVAEALAAFGAVHVWVNNAGADILTGAGRAWPEEEKWDRVIAVDLKSMFLATQAAVPAMARRGGGAVICVSSIAGLRGYGRTAYATAKAGVIGFVRSVAVQLGPKGIRVNAIAPGPVWTPMVEDLGSAARERRRRASPLGTEGTGWDIGWGAVYLASDEARWVTGQTLIIDAGLTVTTPEGSLGAQ